jgi:hypothetical protein
VWLKRLDQVKMKQIVHQHLRCSFCADSASSKASLPPDEHAA